MVSAPQFISLPFDLTVNVCIYLYVIFFQMRFFSVSKVLSFLFHADNEMEKSPLLSNGYNPPPKGLMAQYMALNGGMPHPALLAHTGLPLPPHPAPWATHADHPFKNGPHPENLAR